MNSKQIFSKYTLPKVDEFLIKINETLEVLRNEQVLLRPLDETDCSGAFIDIGAVSNSSIPVVIVPDLHARVDFINEILNFSFQFDGKNTITIKEALDQNKVFVVCVGDGLHAEKRAQDRWIHAQEEWLGGNILNNFLCSEMEEGLTLMATIMDLKKTYPTNFHFLKGNHENILNDSSCGNLPFRKFAMEGEMVRDFMVELYGSEVICAYADFENNLPLFVRGKNFLVSHAEPARTYSKEELINAYCDESTIIGLTWTNNDEAKDDSVQNMLKDFLPGVLGSVYFAGHRAIVGTHKKLRDGQFIQIHNPNEHFISIVHPENSFDPVTDIYDTRTGKKADVGL